MKKAIFLFILFAQIACSKTRFLNEDLTSAILTKAEYSAEELKHEDIFVSENDIQKYIDFREKAKDYQPNSVLTISSVNGESDVAYSPSGTWNADGENYTSNKKMIYNFSISQ